MKRNYKCYQLNFDPVCTLTNNLKILTSVRKFGILVFLDLLTINLKFFYIKIDNLQVLMY